MTGKHDMPTILSDDDIRRIIIKRRRRRRLIRRALAGALLLFTLLFVLLPDRSDASFDRNTIKSSVDETAEEPKITADAAEIYSLDLEQVVYQKNAEEKIDPYSITKILTCYLVLENVDLDRKVKITENKFEDYVDGSHIMLLEGEEVSVRDLLHATMLSSANDAAYYLAIAAAGSEEAFADMMNEQVKNWGCSDTHFVNPNGWKNKNHYTTAHDMSIITARCFESKALQELAGTKEYVIDENAQSERRDLINYFWKSVSDVGAEESILWGKTGSWSEDDCSIVLEFRDDHLNASIVLLRDSMDNRSDDIDKLIEYARKITPGFTVTTEGEVAAHARVKGSSDIEAALAADRTVTVYPKSGKDKDIKVTVDVDDLEVPLDAGQPVGTYTVTISGDEVESGELLVYEDVEQGGALSIFYISDHSAMIGLAVVICAISLVIILEILKHHMLKSSSSYKERYPRG